MEVAEELSRLEPGRETALTIGFFDGVHLGHRHLIDNLKGKAAGEGLLPVVVTFNRHPRLVLGSGAGLAYLTGFDERRRLLEGLGVGLVATLSFTKELADLSARDFVGLLKRHLRMKAMVIGPGFALGRGREGDEAALRTLGQELDFTVDVASPLTLGGELVSSTSIRSSLSQGDMAKVNRFLGRPFSLGGPVVRGVERGRGLGFPTANLAIDRERALPPDGVYVTRAYIDGWEYKSVTNIGVRPTFGEEGRTVEVYILDFEGDLYAQSLRIELLERLRGEIKFASPDELKEQIAKDVERARAILG